MNRPVLKQVAIYSTVSTLVVLSVISYYLDSTLIFPERMLTALPARLVFPIEVIFLPELDSSIYAKQIGLFYLGTVIIFSILCFARVYVSPDDINASINDGYLEYQRLHTKVLFIGIYMRFQSIYFLFVFDSNSNSENYKNYVLGQKLAAMSPFAMVLSGFIVTICILLKFYAYLYNKSHRSDSAGNDA